MFKATVRSLDANKRRVIVLLSANGTGDLRFSYSKKHIDTLRNCFNLAMNTDKAVTRVGHTFLWEFDEFEKNLPFPTQYIGEEYIVKEKPLTIDANDAVLRSGIPESWFRVEQLWKKRGGGDFQFHNHKGLLVAGERKTITDLLNSIRAVEHDAENHKQSKLTRQLKQILEADISYLIIEGRNWKRNPKGHICITDDYHNWKETGWTTRSLDAFKESWSASGIIVRETENSAHTCELVLNLWSYHNKAKHTYLEELLKTKEKG